MINWNRLFPPLRHRQNANYQDHRPSDQDTPPPTEVSEEQVIFFYIILLRNGQGSSLILYCLLTQFLNRSPQQHKLDYKVTVTIQTTVANQLGNFCFYEHLSVFCI